MDKGLVRSQTARRRSGSGEFFSTVAVAGLTLAAAIIGGVDVASAETAAGTSPAPAAPPAAPPKSIYDRIWALPKLYSNPANPWIEELSIVGREQVDFYHFDADQGDATNFVNRRTRIGLKALLFKTVTAHVETDLDFHENAGACKDPTGTGGCDEVYTKLTDAYVKWSPQKWLNLTVGKHGAKFTLDGSTSSTQLITIDRSNIANNFWFPDEYVPGVSVSGDVGKWSYNAGIFTAGDENSEFGDFKGDYFVLVSGGYDLNSIVGIDKALIRLDYVYQNPDPQNDFTRPSDHVLSLSTQWEKGRWGLYTDVDYADGYGAQSDLVGGQIMPAVKLFETWQVVLRYTGISSDDPNGIRFSRYENKVIGVSNGKAVGDEYHEIYLGLNKYFYGHKLKWQTGLQYANMDDAPHDGGHYNGWGVTTGLRVSW